MKEKGISMNEEMNNAIINAKLKALYEQHTPEFLAAWEKAFKCSAPCRINEFGIIDIHRYNAHKAILFIGRETNGWSDEEYRDGCLFRDWMHDISLNGIKGRGHVSRHPNMWYNIGRWALLIQSPETPIDEIANAKDAAVEALGTIAFTNVNKVRGKNKIGKEYEELAYTDIVRDLIQKEVAIINPKVIVTCGTWRPVASFLPDFKGKIICMNHPGARKSSRKMLQELQTQLSQEGV